MLSIIKKFKVKKIKKTPLGCLNQRESLAASYSRTIERTTIGVKVLNFCVRYGNRCDHFAIATRPFL